MPASLRNQTKQQRVIEEDHSGPAAVAGGTNGQDTDNRQTEERPQIPPEDPPDQYQTVLGAKESASGS